MHQAAPPGQGAPGLAGAVWPAWGACIQVCALNVWLGGCTPGHALCKDSTAQHRLAPKAARNITLRPLIDQRPTHPPGRSAFVCSVDLSPASGFLRQLCYFANPAVAADVQLLARACQLVLSWVPPSPEPAAGQQPPVLLFCSLAAGGSEQAAVVLRQAEQLLALCLAALAQHAAELAPELQQPRAGLAAAASSGGVVAPILEALLVLTESSRWEPALGSAAAAAAAATAQIMAGAVSEGLFGQLADIAAAACPEDGLAAAATGVAEAGGRLGVPAGEALVTALTVRYISQQQAVAQRLQQREQAASRQPAAGGTAGRQLPLLLCMPLLLRRLPTLKPVTTRLWRQAVAALHTLPAGELADWLHTSHATGASAAMAAAALLGNLLEGAAAALKAEDQQQLAAVRQPALQFAALASALLALLPQQPFFPTSSGVVGSGGAAGGSSGRSSSRWAEDEDEEEQQATALVAATAAPAVARLPWDAELLPSASLSAQLQLVADGSLLRALVRAVLPVASAADTSSSSSGGQQQQQVPLQQQAADVRRLCGLLHQLMALPGQRQRVLVMLAFRADLVQRLWFSYLRPAQAAPGGLPIQTAVLWTGAVVRSAGALLAPWWCHYARTKASSPIAHPGPPAPPH